MHKLSQHLKPDVMMVAATLNNGANTPLWVSMANYDALLMLIQSAAIASGGAVTAQLRQAKTAAGGTPKDITGKTAAFTDAEDDTVKTIDLRSEEMDVNNGYIYVGVLITETGSQNAAISATSIRGRAAYAQAVLPA
jgi:hypothetical protein